MLKRIGGYLSSLTPEKTSIESQNLEKFGYVLVKAVFDQETLDELGSDINRVFDTYTRDQRNARAEPAFDEMFRYEMLNRSEVCQQAIAHPRILQTIECLLGDDCHVIANTAWRNPANQESRRGGPWHIDAGPHVPLPEGVKWPDNIPHPIFAIGAHIFLQDCELDDGPTGVIPQSHLSGRFPPREQSFDDQLTYNEQGVVPILAQAGDVSFFVSDIWHRRMPTGTNDKGRFFLQVHYGRRDIAQRLWTSEKNNQLSNSAIKRAQSKREKTIIGLHQPQFYDG